MYAHRRLLALLAVTALVLSSALHGSAVSQDSPDAPETIVLRLAGPTGWLADLRVREGGTARVSIERVPEIGLQVRREPSGRIALDVLDLSVGTDEAAPARDTAVLSVGEGVDLSALVGRPLTVVWIGGSAAPPDSTCRPGSVSSSEAGAAATTPQRPCTTCCVACDGITVCGCQVATACGSCCCPAACSC